MIQKNSDLDVRRLAARMGAALPAYRSFRNRPAWPPMASAAELPDVSKPSAPAAGEPAAALASPASPQAVQDPAVAPVDVGIASLRVLLTAQTSDAPRPAPPSAPPHGGFPLIEAALAARPAAPAGGTTLAALRDRLSGASQPMGQ